MIAVTDSTATIVVAIISTLGLIAVAAIGIVVARIHKTQDGELRPIQKKHSTDLIELRAGKENCEVELAKAGLRIERLEGEVYTLVGIIGKENK